jgi:hypothetical protein
MGSVSHSDPFWFPYVSIGASALRPVGAVQPRRSYAKKGVVPLVFSLVFPA